MGVNGGAEWGLDEGGLGGTGQTERDGGSLFRPEWAGRQY